MGNNNKSVQQSSGMCEISFPDIPPILLPANIKQINGGKFKFSSNQGRK